jgi:hypothetical protein
MSKPVRAECVGDFLRQIVAFRKRHDFGANDNLGPWFRGHQRAHWRLCPKLYREYGSFSEIRKDDTEDELREDFITRAPILSEAVPNGDAQQTEWGWYFLMQHYGAPTRLLDWTDGALIGLYFAVRDNPWILNKRSIGEEWVLPPSASGVTSRDRDLVKRWLPARFTKLKDLPIRPVAVFPAHTARRISSQRSCFTIHGSNQDGLDNLERQKGGSYLEKIVIPAYCTRMIQGELAECGIDESTIFPDLGGLSRSVSERWRPEYEDEDPDRDAYKRLRPSKVHKGGIGVFAIRAINKGTLIFAGDLEEMVWIDSNRLSRKTPRVRALYDDFAIIKNGRHGCPTTFNRLTLSWYINEPARGHKPNVRCDPETYDFYALNNIPAGDELTVDYKTYSEAP